MNDEFQHQTGAPRASSRGHQGSQPSGIPSAMDLPLPEDLQGMLRDGEYVVEAFLGQGGMGAVYKGLQMPLRRPVAIKILQRRHLEDDYHFEDRFRREAYAMASLTHPNVVQVYDCGDAGDSFLFISMELVDGGDLSQAMKGGQVTPSTALQLFIPICEGVQAAHEHGLVHRDIKPANIFLTSDSRPKVADFGLAKRFDAQSTFMTKTGLGMGTPDYAAPEQYEEVADLDHRADIYSLGVMFYQMLTGHLPRGAYKPPSRLVHVDPRLDGVVQKAMQNDRTERYQQVDEMKRDVEHILATWMMPPKPRVVTPGNVPPRTTGRVPTLTGRVPVVTGRVPTLTGRVPTVTGQMPAHATHGPHTSHVPTATGRVHINHGLVPSHLAQVPGHPHPSLAPQGEPIPVLPARGKPGLAILGGLVAAIVLVGGGAWVFFGKDKPVAGASTVAASTQEGVPGESSAVSLPPLPVRPALQTLDLLALTDPAGDRVSAPGFTDKNEWYREGGSLIYRADGKSGKIAPPVALDCRDYELELRVERLSGTGRIHLDVPVKGSRILPLILNDPNRRILNERDASQWPGHAVVTHVTVRIVRGAGGAGDRLVLQDKTNGKVLLDWQGDMARLGRSGEAHPQFPGNLVTSLFVHSDPYAVRLWKLRVFDGAAKVLRTAAEKPALPPSSIVAFGGHRYQAFDGQFDWGLAKAKAEEMGGRLAVIESREEHEALKQAFDERIPAGSGLWIGAGTEAGPGQMRWLTGGKVTFHVWGPGEPNEQIGAVMMIRNPRAAKIVWADFPHHGRGRSVMNRGFIVEWEDDKTVAEAPGNTASGASMASASPAAAVTPPATSVAPQPAPSFAPADARLAQLEAGFKARHETDALKPYAAAMATLNEGYLRALTSARAAAQKSGNLVELTAIDEETARTKSGRPPPPADVEHTPVSLVKLRATYRSAMARHATTRDRAAAPLYDLYVRALDVYIAELTKANNITRAREVQELRGKIAAQKPVLDPPAVAETAPNARPPAGARGKAPEPATGEVTASSSWRQLATWVLSVNGQVVVERDGVRMAVSPTNAKDLPSGKFSVRLVQLMDPAGNARLTDDDLTLLANAPDLEHLDIRDAPEITRLPALRGLRKIERIVLHRCPKVKPELFAELAGKQSLTEVDLYGSLTALEGISALASCSKLTSLNVNATSLNDGSLAEVARIKSLRLLHLGGTPITDEGLLPLASLPSLETLTLDGCAEIRGRTLSSLTQLATLKQLNLRNVRLNTEHIPVIGRFISLELLALDGMAGIDDDALASFSNLPRLRTLMLYGTNVTGTGFATMKRSEELQQLNLGSRAPVTNEGLQAIAAAFPKLAELSLGDGGTWDADGLKALASLDQLKQLFAQGADGCGDKELEVISGFKQLDSLSLPNAQANGASLGRLSSLKLLTALDLSGAATVGDGAIPALGRLRGLRSLQLRGTAITESGVEALKKQLPNASIAR